MTEVIRKLGISEQTFYRWKKRFTGLGIAELRRLQPHTLALRFNPVPEPSYHLVQETQPGQV